jgi:nicotinamidase-related amidase
MAIIREGKKSVLLVVDVQVDVMANLWEKSRVIENIHLAVEKARAANIPVIWVQHEDENDGLAHGTPDWEIVPELVPAEGETRIYKEYNSAFEQTNLEETLAALGATHVILAGAATNWCIRATAHGTLENGYDLTLLKDAHTTESIELLEFPGEVIEAKNIIRELNIAIKWMGYPGVKNNTLKVEELDFSKLN